MRVAEQLIKQYGVAVIPGAAFGMEAESTAAEGIRRLSRACATWFCRVPVQ